ncbi:hypothetical protein TUM19329_27350 [Legionella antarctica]|uniref:Transposase n=1 Tax=Legionella antarctica TaxID=2708020 RepID=A0A6F8T6R3_9GAMM|nr:hypothetical protein [Legionella antarctica]BCA96374.1 hypothetical protein TUM19329_27350 [Legionella antarctica]
MQIGSYDVAYVDETVLQFLNEQGRLATSTSYMWLLWRTPDVTFLMWLKPLKTNPILSN